MMNSSCGEPNRPEPPGEKPAPPMTPDELQRAVSAADPGAFLLLPRILRRVIKQDRRLGGFALRPPHRKSYVIRRAPLLKIVERSELGVDQQADLPETVVLLARPSPVAFAQATPAELLNHCWRLLFHARIHAALDERLSGGRLAPALIRRRIQAIGFTEFDEIRTVLAQEDLLLPLRSDKTTGETAGEAADEAAYVEFAATYLELRRFAPSFLLRYFPGLTDLESVDSLIREDVDDEALFQATRPAGAGDPCDVCELDEWAESDAARSVAFQNEIRPTAEAVSEKKHRFFMRKAIKPASLGNVVRAAIWHARAQRCAPPELIDRTRAAVHADLQQLANRLRAALAIEETGPAPWMDSLGALLDRAADGVWTVEARLLYDLQKACVNREREVYTIDLIEWALSLGRRPIKRSLPHQRDVLMLKHLQSAAGRLAAARISDLQRRDLGRLMRESIERVEARLRERLRRIIAAALDEVKLIPQNLPERMARKKMVEELLDTIGERGFLSMSDLRDAISRNNFKLPDQSLPLGIFQSDQLLQADRKLAAALDGVYRRGEFYLRWMQRASSLGFGTGVGRFLTRFAVVPFGGAFVVLAFVHEVWHWIAGSPAMPPPEAEFDELALTTTELHLTSPSVVLLLGLFLLCLVNSEAFRRFAGRSFTILFRVLRAATIEPIRWFVHWPLLQRILHSRAFSLVFRLAVKPLFWTGVAWWLLPVHETNWSTIAGTGVPMFLTFNLLLNSRVGRNIEEMAADEIVQGWRRFGLRFFTGLFWAIVDLFKYLMETVERLMYAVDEWLRFRGGEGRGLLAVKAVLGSLWFFVAYFLRFAVNVLIEPQINPIKHFPVVTVAHKLLFAAYKPFTNVLEAWLGIGVIKAAAIATSIIWCIPGIFGFLVWELKENWRLYAANRRRWLGSVMIGSHGENMGRLLKPGFHSGTLPKRFAKLRRAERHARAGGDWSSVRRQLQAVEHVELSVRRYVEREFLEFFAESRCWQLPPIALETIHLSTSGIRLSLACPAFDEASRCGSPSRRNPAGSWPASSISAGSSGCRRANGRCS